MRLHQLATTWDYYNEQFRKITLLYSGMMIQVTIVTIKNLQISLRASVNFLVSLTLLQVNCTFEMLRCLFAGASHSVYGDYNVLRLQLNYKTLETESVKNG